MGEFAESGRQIRGCIRSDKLKQTLRRRQGHELLPGGIVTSQESSIYFHRLFLLTQVTLCASIGICIEKGCRTEYG